MHVHLRCAAMGLALVISAGSAIAQTPPIPGGSTGNETKHDATPPAHALSKIQLTPEQRMKILNAVRQDSKGAAPVNFAASPGAPVPPSIELYMLPDSVLAELPETKVVKYTTVQNQIVLVDPLTMRVVDVLR